MATPKINENCHYVQNDSHKSKIKLKKIQFDILYRFGVIKESLPGGVESAPPPGEIGLTSGFDCLQLALQCILQYKLINIFRIKNYFWANLKRDVTKNRIFWGIS